MDFRNVSLVVVLLLTISSSVVSGKGGTANGKGLAKGKGVPPTDTNTCGDTDAETGGAGSDAGSGAGSDTETCASSDQDAINGYTKKTRFPTKEVTRDVLWMRSRATTLQECADFVGADSSLFMFSYCENECWYTTCYYYDYTAEPARRETDPNTAPSTRVTNEPVVVYIKDMLQGAFRCEPMEIE